LVRQGAGLDTGIGCARGHDGPFAAAESPALRHRARHLPVSRKPYTAAQALRKARSKKKRILLLADLDHRYKAAP